MTMVPSSSLHPTPTSRIHGCWLGKSIGGTLGLPAEGRMERLHFSFYDPVPTVAPPNDDLELQLVWLHLAEQAGTTLTRADFARAWVDHLHYMWDEYGICRWNLRRGVPVDSIGTFENPFQAGMGSPIRSEIWACLFPGDSDGAAHYAAMDASLDHGAEGVAGEVLFAVMQCRVAAGAELEEAIPLALDYLPEDCETRTAVELVRTQFAEGIPVWDCWRTLLARHGSENFTHAPLNVSLTIWALLYGESDFEKSILLAVNGGYDTDCTAATVGATLGLLHGAEGIPESWSDPIGTGVFVGPGIQGILPPRTLEELTERTLALQGKLEPRKWSMARWKQPPTNIDLSTLPGTITIQPRNGTHPIHWANGELPAEVKAAGGCSWIWTSLTDDPCFLICLARSGARLFLDDHLLIDCPAGLPFVPAPHRCPTEARAAIQVPAGTHSVRVELTSRDPEQAASVLLTYRNYHLRPWTAQELPYPAQLPIA